MKERKIRILFLTHYSELLGANLSLLNLLKGLKKFNLYAFVILIRRGPIEIELQKLSIDYKIIQLRPFMKVEQHASQDIQKLRQGLKNMKEGFHIKNYNRMIIKREIDFLVEKRFDLVYTNSSILDVGIVISKILNKPHVWHIREAAEIYYNYKPLLGKYYLKYLFKSGSFIAISNFIRDYIKAIDKDASIEVVYNGVLSEYEVINLNSRRKLLPSGTNKPFKFLMLGNLQFQKRYDEAIDAIKVLSKKYDNIRLKIVGHGDSQYLVDLIEESGLQEKITIGNYAKDPFAEFLNANAFLLCSRNEGMGRVIAEAMFSGVPVITHNSGGPKEIIRNKYNGLKYNGTFENLARSMEDIMTNIKLRNNIISNAYIDASDKFTVEKYCSDIHSIIRKKVSDS